MSRKRKPVGEKLKAGVAVCDITGCWIWQKRLKRGYGPHRLAYRFYKGPIPDGLDVLHNCPHGDNPACINPDHLWVGTHRDNMLDKINKGRANIPHGEGHHNSKLSEAQVLDILNWKRGGETGKEKLADLAARHGVSRYTVKEIRLGYRWKRFQKKASPS